MWIHCLKEYDDLKGIAWRWQILGSQTVSAPVKGEKTRKNLTDNGKLGTKRQSSIRMVFLWSKFSLPFPTEINIRALASSDTESDIQKPHTLVYWPKRIASSFMYPNEQGDGDSA